MKIIFQKFEKYPYFQMDGSMSGSVNGMVINNDGSKFVTGGDDKVFAFRFFEN